MLVSLKLFFLKYDNNCNIASSTEYFLTKPVFNILSEFNLYDLGSSDCLILSLSDKFSFSKTIPAKLQTYLASKKPVLALTSGEVENIIKLSKCGYVSRSNNVDDFKKKILKMSKNDNKTLKKLGNNGFNYLIKNFNRNTQLNKLQNFILNM